MINQFLLPGDKALSEIHLRQPKFTCIASGPLIKNRKNTKFKEKVYKSISKIYLSKQLNKVCF